MFKKILNLIHSESSEKTVQEFLRSSKLINFAVFATFSISSVTMPATATLSMTALPEVQEAKIEQHYIVQKGDLMLTIARKFNISERQLVEANGLASAEAIKAGQDLIIPELSWQEYEGVASWYGPGFHGRTMANGDIYDQNEISVAHRTLPLGQKIKITNLKNGKSIIAPVLDRGPYIYKNGAYTREVDLSYAAAKALGTVGTGLARVKIEIIKDEAAFNDRNVGA